MKKFRVLAIMLAAMLLSQGQVMAGREDIRPGPPFVLEAIANPHPTGPGEVNVSLKIIPMILCEAVEAQVRLIDNLEVPDMQVWSAPASRGDTTTIDISVVIPDDAISGVWFLVNNKGRVYETAIYFAPLEDTVLVFDHDPRMYGNDPYDDSKPILESEEKKKAVVKKPTSESSTVNKVMSAADLVGPLPIIQKDTTKEYVPVWPYYFKAVPNPHPTGAGSVNMTLKIMPRIDCDEVTITVDKIDSLILMAAEEWTVPVVRGETTYIDVRAVIPDSIVSGVKFIVKGCGRGNSASRYFFPSKDTVIVYSQDPRFFMGKQPPKRPHNWNTKSSGRLSNEYAYARKRSRNFSVLLDNNGNLINRTSPPEPPVIEKPIQRVPWYNEDTPDLIWIPVGETRFIKY